MVPPRIERVLPAPVMELDEPTLVDAATCVVSPPPVPLPPPPVGPMRRMRAAQPTQIVAPLPAPREYVDPPARIHDTQSTGGQISGEVSNGAPLEHHRARPTRLAAGWIGGAVATVAILVVAIGLSAPSPATPMRAVDAMRRALTDREPARAPHAAVIVEELPVPPRTAPPAVPEPPTDPEPATVPEPPTAAKPTRSRHHAPSVSGVKSPAGTTHRPARSRAARQLTYDPDALFLHRP